MCVSCIFLVIKGDEKEMKKRMCVCVVLCFICSFIYVVLLKKKEYKMKYKNVFSLHMAK